MQLKWDSGYAVNYNIHFLAEEKMFLSIGHSIQLSQMHSVSSYMLDFGDGALWVILGISSSPKAS